MHKEKADIFISYAHLDDDDAMGDKGWVTRFHAYLEPRIKKITGDKKIIVWRDNKLTGNDDFSEQIHDQLSDNALLISIYSPAYVNSPWCGREVDVFRQGKLGSHMLGSKSRIFKVSKIRIPRSDEPDFMQKMLGYRFYNDKGLEYDEAISPEERQAYHDKLNDLAIDISKLLQLLKAEEAESKKLEEVTVFLADSPDCVTEREKLYRELTSAGMRVIPDQFYLDPDEKNYQKKIDQLLSEADVCVQLIGEEQGMRWASDRSMLGLIYERFLSQIKNRNLPGFFWIRKQEHRGDHMKRFLERFYEEIDVIPTKAALPLHVLDGSTIQEANQVIMEFAEQLKSEKSTAKASDEENIQKTNSSYILLLISSDDEQSIKLKELYQYLFSKGLELRLCRVDPDRTEELTVQVQQASEVVIFYGMGSSEWLTGTQAMIDPMCKEGDLNRYVFVAEPSSFEKELLSSHTYTIIRGLNAASLGDLPELLPIVQKAG